MRIRAKVLAGIAITGIALFTTTGTAHAFGPPPGPSHVGCDSVWMDPPNVGYLQVTIHGTIDGSPVDETVGYGAEDAHKALFPQTLARFLTAGAHSYDVWWTWTLGPGDSAHAKGTLTCQTPPTSSPTTTPPTTPSSSTTTSVPVSPTSTCNEPRGCCLKDCGPTNLAAKELPKTGSSTLPAGLAGGTSLAAGIALLISSRRRAR